MRARHFLIAASALAFATVADAGALRVQVEGADGKPVADAVVTLHASGRPTAAPPTSGSYVVSQKDIQFHPFVSVVPVGGNISFPNLDPVRHHVYSFSPAKRFELKLYAKDQTRSVVFDKAGIVAIGCNIHDQMSAYIFVTDSVWTAKTDAQGVVTIRNLPAGAFTLSVWHPYSRAPGGHVDKPLAIGAADQRETIVMTMRKAQMQDMSGY